MKNKTSATPTVLLVVGVLLLLLSTVGVESTEAGRPEKNRPLYEVELVAPDGSVTCSATYSPAGCYVVTKHFDLANYEPCEVGAPTCQKIAEEYDFSVFFDDNSWQAPTLDSPSNISPILLEEGIAVTTGAIWFVKPKGKQETPQFGSFGFWGRDCYGPPGGPTISCESTYGPEENLPVFPGQSWDLMEFDQQCDGSFSNHNDCDFIELGECGYLVLQQKKGNHTAYGPYCFDRVQLHKPH